jgi:hypothetical protein
MEDQSMNENFNVDPSKVPLCSCVDEQGQKSFYTVLKISKTEKNPNREFYSCRLSKANGGCGFFSFADEIEPDKKTGLARRKYIKREKAAVPKEEKLIWNQLEERLSTLEFAFEDQKQRLKVLEEEKERTENELPSAKAQKTTGTSSRGKARPKILP